MKYPKDLLMTFGSQAKIVIDTCFHNSTANLCHFPQVDGHIFIKIF